VTDEGHVLRVFRFRPLTSEFDSFLRTVMLPEVPHLPGLLAVHAGRRDHESGGDRIVATVWESRDAMIESVGETVEESRFHPERLAQTVERTLEVLDVRVALPSGTPERPALLRLFRGTVRPGELDDYVEDVRVGTQTDADGGRGPCSLYLAIDPPDAFVTISTWQSWEAITRATGGDIARPAFTRNSRRLVTMDVAHYESVREAT
jgi:heme-degrading monooxygenase HmoA